MHPKKILQANIEEKEKDTFLSTAKLEHQYSRRAKISFLVLVYYHETFSNNDLEKPSIPQTPSLPNNDFCYHEASLTAGLTE